MTRDHVLAFINTLPTSPDPITWVVGFRRALLKMLPDVDHISASINLRCYDPVYRPSTPIRNLVPHLKNHVHESNGVITRKGISSQMVVRDGPGRVLEDMIRFGFPTEKYHPPHQVLLSNSMHYIGSIMLWTDRANKP